MAPPTSTPSNPPRTYFSVWQRLFRGYGPAAVLTVLIVLMALLVPSKIPDSTTASATGNVDTGTGFGTSDGGSGGDSTATTTPGATGAQPGATTAPKQGGGATAAGISQCSGPQVPGDPYSPPCIAFKGDNGGATSQGVTATEIHVAYRVLNEKGFQQTLASLAGASLVGRF